MEALFGIITYGNSHLAPLMHGEKRGEDVSALGCLTLAAEPCPAMGEGTRCVLWAAWVTSQMCHCCDGRPSATQCHLHRPRGIWCNAASLLLHPAAEGHSGNRGSRGVSFFYLDVFLGGFFPLERHGCWDAFLEEFQSPQISNSIPIACTRVAACLLEEIFITRVVIH